MMLSRAAEAANPGQDRHLSPVLKGRFFHRAVLEAQAKIKAFLRLCATHVESVVYRHFHRDMAVLGDSFTPNFGATEPVPSNHSSCLMGQVRRLDPLVKGSHPNRVGRFEGVVQISLGVNKEGRVRMNIQDQGRKWIWWFLGIIAAMQLYFVRELLAVFAIFILGFAGIVLCIPTLYMAQKTGEAGGAPFAAAPHPVLFAAPPILAPVQALPSPPLGAP